MVAPRKMSSETSRPVTEGFAADSAVAPGDDAGALERLGASVRLVAMCGTSLRRHYFTKPLKINTPDPPKAGVPGGNRAEDLF